MQQDQRPAPPIRRPTRLVKFPHPSTHKSRDAELATFSDVAGQPTLSMERVSKLSRPISPAYGLKGIHELSPSELEPDLFDISGEITHLMKLSGVISAVRIQQQQPANQDSKTFVNITGATEKLIVTKASQYDSPPRKSTKVMKGILSSPVAKIFLGLLMGIGLLFLVSRFVNIAVSMHMLQQNLATPRGIVLALLSGVIFLLAFSIRGIRWKLFLNPIGNVGTFTAIRLVLISIFLNFLLPISSGEIVKTLILKRIAAIPISRSLPTVAMDRSLDLLPSLFLMVIVPLLGLQMDIKLWLVLGIVGALFIGLIVFVGLAVWKRTAAITLLQKVTGILPRAMGSKIEGFATGFVDSLVIGASRPKIFIPAVLLTCLAVIFDSLSCMFAFWTIGFPIPFGTAIFGYTLYNMFYIFPTPPGQVGSNEAIGLLVFGGLLRLPPNKVIAMFIFSHPWTALLMCMSGLICLKTLGLTIPIVMKAGIGESGTKREGTLLQREQKVPVLNP
jgi:uncharacterized protein (TIRG00374 family)